MEAQGIKEGSKQIIANCKRVNEVRSKEEVPGTFATNIERKETKV